MATRLPRALRPFASGQYRLLLGGLLLAMFADGIWTVGVVWQVIGMGGGPGALAAVTAGAAIGMVVSALAGGVLADRVSQRWIMFTLEIVKLVTVGLVGLLALTGLLAIPVLVAVSVIGGVTMGMYYPAYSAMLPRLIAADELQAANGVEGVLRPVIFQGAGPMTAGGLIAIASPAAAILASAAASLASAIFYLFMRPAPPLPGEKPQLSPGVRSILADVAAGFSYMVRTRWLWSTLLFVSLTLLMIMGPIQVLIPFLLQERAGGDAGDHALVIAAFGAGAAAGSFLFASLPMPRRYLSVVFAMMGISTLPLVVMGHAGAVWLIMVAAAALGFLFEGPAVLWGTLLQRRTPPRLLGRISSLDFFVRAAFMPVSMALAAPVAAGLGLTPAFVLAGVLPVGFAAFFYLAARLWSDETAHPLRVGDDIPAAPVPHGDETRVV